MGYQEDNDKLFEFFLENSFFKNWRNTERAGLPYNYDGLELMINHKCNLSCKYCYMEKHHKKFFPKGSQDSTLLLKNTDLIIDWLYRKGMTPNIEIFAGDSLTDPTSRKVIHKIFDAALSGKRVVKDFQFPTNGGWLAFDKKREDVNLILEKAEFSGIRSYVSFSVDGKYMEVNRPWKSKKQRYDDGFYEKMFEFLATHPSSGVHPMVYSNNIEQSIENFEWWLEMHFKYGLDWTRMYYLEVRNPEWNAEQVREYAKFIDYLCRRTYELCDRDNDKWLWFLFKRHGFNTLAIPFGRTGRGMPCSIQSCIVLRLGDLMVVPCHRTAYKHMETAQMRVEDDKIIGFDAKNIELFFAIQAASDRVFPYCERCDINALCKGGCLGAQFETSGNLFLPIPSVCRLFFTKVAVMARFFVEVGVSSDVGKIVGKHRAGVLEKIGKHTTEELQWD